MCEFEKIHEKYMAEALLEAQKAFDLNEVPIGAVIVYQDEIIGRGYNRRNTDKSTLAHAEITAISEATKVMGDWRLEGCTLYVTLEPCPMCAGAIVQARVERIVVGTPNLKAGCSGTLINLLQMPVFNHQVEIINDVSQEVCQKMLQDFFKRLRETKKVEKEARRAAMMEELK